MSLKLFKHQCEACEVYRDEVAYLKEQANRLISERAEERAEFKRSVDAILAMAKAPMIGQGYVEHAKSEPVDMGKVMGFLNEEVKPGTKVEEIE